MGAMPAEVNFEDKVLPLWTFEQLNALGRSQLKNRGMNLRDAVGESRLPPFVQGATQQATIIWIIQAQVMLMQASGTQCTPSDFGLPGDFGQAEGGYFGGKPSMAAGNSVDEGMRAPSEPSLQANADAISAHAEAMAGSQAAKNRNRGSNIFG
mmetsp:Transcript_33923/g.56071  ORF Transcript_33923/g.56071 Transcript_33923/m.56071 type:complete len:153 (-) Transcript_33923:282-740(-)|eukprot:CAMPEP_0119306308 /NCGR_PEP_ID=MMETSP1333-20130426/7090_1 /TAXON_ID=418940 /ORGANISM="Scyphosphaera apsteinii, Strain RCC1455" /LENGTH=152 /DNA_ID=CAMNT_0007309573 /DNA_START=37 /DNA_END=495 /DNA_ORIENTATION=-